MSIAMAAACPPMAVSMTGGICNGDAGAGACGGGSSAPHRRPSEPTLRPRRQDNIRFRLARRSSVGHRCGHSVRVGHGAPRSRLGRAGHRPRNLLWLPRHASCVDAVPPHHAAAEAGRTTHSDARDAIRGPNSMDHARAGPTGPSTMTQSLLERVLRIAARGGDRANSGILATAATPPRWVASAHTSATARGPATA